MKNYLVLALFVLGVSFNGMSQCLDFSAFYGPTDGPCLEEPVAQNQSFQVWSDEAYVFDGVEAGVTYTFALTTNLVDGTGDVLTWPADFTILTPSGGVDGFGIGNGDNTITFTATESGSYAFGFIEVGGVCLGGSNAIDNGWATLFYDAGPISSCAPPTPWCSDFPGGFYGPGAAPCAQQPESQYLVFEVWSGEEYLFEGVEAGVTYTFSLANSSVDGTGSAGSWPAEFTVFAPSGAVDNFGPGNGDNSITFTASESGDYIFGFFSALDGCGAPVNLIDNGYATLTADSGPVSDCPSNCQPPADLDVVEIGFGTENARVNGTWTNPEGTTDCEVRGGRISPASYDAGEPEFANINNTQVITQTDGTTVLFNVVLYNNPNVPFVIGQRYGYEVRCQCADGSGYSEWANITPEATFVVPTPPAAANVNNPTDLTKVNGINSAEKKASIKAEKMKPRMQTQWVTSKALQQNKVDIFPNPVVNELNITLDSFSDSNMDVVIYDMTGRVAGAEQLSVNKGMNTFNLDVQNLESGVYVLSVGGVKHSFTKE